MWGGYGGGSGGAIALDMYFWVNYNDRIHTTEFTTNGGVWGGGVGVWGGDMGVVSTLRI